MQNSHFTISCKFINQPGSTRINQDRGTAVWLSLRKPSWKASVAPGPRWRWTSMEAARIVHCWRISVRRTVPMGKMINGSTDQRKISHEMERGTLFGKSSSDSSAFCWEGTISLEAILKFGKRYTMFEPDTFKDQEQTAQTAILGGTHPTVFYCFLGPDISCLEATKKGPKRSIFFHILPYSSILSIFFPFFPHFGFPNLRDACVSRCWNVWSPILWRCCPWPRRRQNDEQKERKLSMDWFKGKFTGKPHI